jgi:hypothetical protein
VDDREWKSRGKNAAAVRESARRRNCGEFGHPLQESISSTNHSAAEILTMTGGSKEY